MAKKLKIKKGQSKYMTHLRAVKSIGVSKQVLGRGGRVGHIPNSIGDAVINEHGITRTKDELATKGKFGGLCNRSCCLRRESYWYNRGSYAYYCEDCARLINAEFRHRDDVENYGTLLVKPPADVEIQETGDGFMIVYSNEDTLEFNTKEEAEAAQRHYRYVAGLRSDGSEPLWYKDLSEKYEYLRTLVTIKDSR